MRGRFLITNLSKCSRRRILLNAKHWASSCCRGLFDRLVFLAVGLWAWTRFPRLLRAATRQSLRHGMIPNPVTPRSADEKFLWRKLFDHDPRFAMVTGKLGGKEWVRSKGLDLPMAKVLWVGADAGNIPDALLNRDVVIKANSGCGTNLFARDLRCDREQLLAITRGWLSKPYGQERGEWAYEQVPALLLVEEMLRPANGVLDEIKVYTYGDRVGRVVYIHDRFGDLGGSLWEPDASGCLVKSERLPTVARRPSRKPLPESIGLALQHARVLGADFDHIRVDFYTDGCALWFGELTVYNEGGRVSHVGHDRASRLTQAWDIRRSAFLRDPRRGWRGVYASALRRWLQGRDHQRSVATRASGRAGGMRPACAQTWPGTAER